MLADLPISKTAIALCLTSLTVLATCAGSLLAFLPGANGKRFVSAALGLSAGVIIYVALMGIMPESIEKLENLGKGWAISALAGGMAIMAALDFLLPKHSDSHAPRNFNPSCPDDENSRRQRKRMRRTGLMLAATIAVHNFPEGMATFVAALDSIEVALPLAIAICIHNIPMGIAMATPLYYGTCSRKKALAYTFCSAAAALVGALFALYFLLPWWSPQIEAVCMAAVAGVLLFITFDELLPEAEAYGHHHLVMCGLIAGIILMAVCLMLLGHSH
ncbi:MAG: ZIP family metal transporter [Muribaculum sp.]|nr:ZIP family metal transporter [Muribaculaceae bacterium]MCM1081186.1 ZIP family metal transporter [Muribaculum sp.]